jgi:hypothetical protein
MDVEVPPVPTITENVPTLTVVDPVNKPPAPPPPPETPAEEFPPAPPPATINYSKLRNN